MRGDSGVAGEGRVVGLPKFHSWGKCTMLLTNINASSGLCVIYIYLRGSFKVTGYLELYDFIYVYIYATKTGILKS